MLIVFWQLKSLLLHSDTTYQLSPYKCTKTDGLFYLILAMEKVTRKFKVILKQNILQCSCMQHLHCKMYTDRIRTTLVTEQRKYPSVTSISNSLCTQTLQYYPYHTLACGRKHFICADKMSSTLTNSLSRNDVFPVRCILRSLPITLSCFLCW